RGLLAAGGRDIGHDRGYLVDRLDDLGERATRLVDELDPVLDLAAAAGDQVLDVLRRLRGTLRQIAHFRSDDREAAAGFAGARRLHRGVERQQVGLPGDLVDHADDVGNLARRALDLAHGLDRLGDNLAAAAGDLARIGRGLVGLESILGV